MTWTDVGVFACNVVEGLALALIVFVVGGLAVGWRPEFGDREAEVTTYWYGDQEISRAEYEQLVNERSAHDPEVSEWMGDW